MTDNYPGIANGPIDDAAITINYIADEAIEIGAPVIYVAAGTGEILPRVEPSTGGTLTVAGVVVGGDAEGVWSDGTVANDGNAADAAGETVRVCSLGRCKVRVNGSTGGVNSNIALGDALSIGAADEIAQRAVTSDFVFGRALQATIGVSDAIACYVTLEGLDALTA